MSARANIEVFKGETLLKELVLSDSSGTAIDLTNFDISGTVRRNYTEASGVNFAISATAPTSGTFTFGLDESVTEDLTFTKGVYDIFLIDPINSERMVILYGDFIVLPAATRFA